MTKALENSNFDKTVDETILKEQQKLKNAQLKQMRALLKRIQ